MESEDVYYTESTEIIDVDGCWGMQEAVIVENENLDWQEEGPEITVGYVESTDETVQTLTENEAYLSTNAEDSVDTDKSQYYSILETTYQDDGYTEDNVSADIIVKVDNQHESILPDMPDSEEYEVASRKETNNDESLNNQVVLYHSDDPNEMYAIQIADDGSGNLQRYKYKVRQTEDGQLEAIPGTIELQDVGEDEGEKKVEEATEEMSDVHNDDIDPTKLLLAKLPQEVHDAEEYQEEVHLKQEYLAVKANSAKATEENFDASESYLDEEYGTPEYLLSDDNTYGEDDEPDYRVMSPNEDDLGLKMQKSYQLEVNPDINYYEDEDSNVINEEPKRGEEEFLIENGSVKSITQTDIKRKFFKSKFNNSAHHVFDGYNEHLSDNKEVTVFRDERNVSYLLVDTKEKENVSVSQIKTTFGIKNARSILKTNYIVPMEDPKKNIKKIASIRMLNNNKGIITKEGYIVKPNAENRDEHKITEVKIAAKSVRQPRKQTIKPVERVGSEIIVQPMYYTFNNDYPELEVRKKRKYTHRNSQDVVKVSDDSDPDYTEKPKPKKKKTSLSRRLSKSNKKITQIVIDSSDISTDAESVIEVLSGEETDIEKLIEEKLPEEKVPEPEEDPDLDKSDDIMKIQEAVDDIVQERNRAEKIKNDKAEEEKSTNNIDKTIKKNNIKCPICPKTFPRQINLKTHMNIHSARRVLRSKSNSISKTDETKSAIKKPSNTVKKPQSFSCTKCKLKFMSENQLLRHQIIHKDKKSFIPKNATPRKHQFLRSKNNLTPRKLNKSPSKLTRSSAVVSKPDGKKVVSPKGPFKCEYCPKSFSQRVLLNAHRAIHKPFPCCNCTLKFTTKVLLDEHLRKSCVKTQLRPNSVRRSPVKSKVSETLHKCGTCNKFFSTASKLNEHIATAHKKLSNKPSAKKVITRPKKAHGGVPPSGRMQRAFDIMKLRS